jgi:hypothetical protein
MHYDLMQPISTTDLFYISWGAGKRLLQLPLMVEHNIPTRHSITPQYLLQYCVEALHEHVVVVDGVEGGVALAQDVLHVALTHRRHQQPLQVTKDHRRLVQRERSEGRAGL